ncbi:hypothetical protein ES332_A02G063100v1 [Gossypium tomentosum]|uniref:DUF4219 domain-containing protein n=1 Tax=Gossypium tomentosum TaxID=34277 RepID=A0A5D2RDN4_GOSTO|nr:hypothetical protein ES332_A02G063100v1 [Gossypium tomentosum]
MLFGSFTSPPPPSFAGENYYIWVMKMKIFDSDREPPLLRANPTIAQTRKQIDEVANKYKALSCLQNSVSDVIFTRIMACETPKQA